MAYDSKKGFYYNFYVNNRELDFNPSYVSSLVLNHSIFNLFPTVSFSLANTNNSLYQQGLVNSKNLFKIEMGTKQTDEQMEIFKDLYVEHIHMSNMKSSFSGALETLLIHKSSQLLNLSSIAKSWFNLPTSTVIQQIMTQYVASTDLNIETTNTTGIWIKPSNQSEYNFLKILKNRSLSAITSPSKMFMWIDLYGKFNFKSLSSLLNQTPALSIDFTDAKSEYYTPTDFDYRDNGIRYKDVDVNTGYKEYVFNVTGNGVSNPLVKPVIPKIDGPSASDPQIIDTVTTSQDIMYGYYHSKLPLKYNYSQYVNDNYNFPFRMSFKMKNNPLIRPGVILNLQFPHYDKRNRLIDTSLSGKYLVTGVTKKETRGLYVISVSVVSNSQLQPITALR